MASRSQARGSLFSARKISLWKQNEVLISFPQRDGLLLPPAATHGASFAPHPTPSIPTSILFTSAWEGSPRLFCYPGTKHQSNLSLVQLSWLPFAGHLPGEHTGCSPLLLLLLPAVCWAVWIISSTTLKELSRAACDEINEVRQSRSLSPPGDSH